MSKDRIKDLEKNLSWANVSYEPLSRQFVNHEDDTSGSNNRYDSIAICSDNLSAVTDFLHETNSIRAVIDRLDNLSQQVKRIHIETLSSSDSKLVQDLNHKTEEIKKLSFDTSTQLKKMQQSLATPNNRGETNAQRRIKEAQIFVLTRRFRDTMVQYNQETVVHRERCKKSIARELAIAGDHKSNDELEEMLEKDISETFNFSIFIDAQKAKQCLGDIDARHRDILRLENSIKELHDMLRDLAMFVADQGEMIDRIEYNVAKAANYVEGAAENVKKTGDYAKKASKKKIIVFILLVTGVCLIILIVFIGYFTQKKIRGR